MRDDRAFIHRPIKFDGAMSRTALSVVSQMPPA
jgi:hypothetical protein